MEEDKVELVKVHIKENQSDAFTEILSRDSFQMCVARFSLKGKAEFTRIWEHQGGECELKYGAPMP